MVYQWLKSTHSWLYPPVCILCDDPGHNELDLCTGCLADLVCNDHHCFRCGDPIAVADVSLLCGMCQRHPPWYQQVVAPFLYQPPMSYLVHQLKYAKKLYVARLFGELLARHLSTVVDVPDVLIPVPLHRKRLRERGFNQSLEIGRVISKRLHVPVKYQLCKRARYTDSQSLLPAKDRKSNVRNAFEVCGNVKGKHIAIVDDVMTTGHTVNELARMLRVAGASEIDVWVVARATSG